MGRDHLNCLVLSYTLGRWGSKKPQNRWYTVMPCWSVLLILLVVSKHLQHFLTIPLKTCILKAFGLGPSSLTKNKTQIAVINILNLRILITWLFVRYSTYIFKSGIKTVTIFEKRPGDEVGKQGKVSKTFSFSIMAGIHRDPGYYNFKNYKYK